jgi:predicted ATPase
MSKSLLKSNFFILTGGPGSGKTSVLRALKARGYLTVPEVARDIIKEQLALGGNAMHTGDRQAFLEKMLKHSLDDYLIREHEKTAVFFDRGLPDLYGYAKRFCNMEHQQVNNAVARFKYSDTVFIFPPWKEIYINDNERQQDYNESIETYAALKEAYELCGYHLLEIPFLSVEERVDFILRKLKHQLED